MIYLILSFILISIAESFSEKYVILLKDGEKPNYKELDDKEHIYSMIHYIIIVSCLILLTTTFDVFIYAKLFTLAAVVRRLFFSKLLNLHRGKKITYLSNRGVDGFLKDTLGETVSLILEILIFLTLIFI
jgi:hypothetical protein